MAESSKVKNDKKLNKNPNKTIYRKLFGKIADWLAVSKPGGLSEQMAKIQDKLDEWVDIVEDQAVNDIDKIKKHILRLYKNISKSLSVSEAGGLSEQMAKAQDISDEWVDIVEDQLVKDISKIKKSCIIAGRCLIRWFAVSEPGGLSSFVAAGVNKTDFLINVLADNIVFQAIRLRSAVNKSCTKLWKKRMLCLKYFTVVVILTICTVAAFNHVTGYEYSYNGRVLGLVKNQEDALKVLNIASKGLTSEYGVDVQIDPKEDVTFRRVAIVDKTVDNMDEVLRKFTYMQDTKATAYAIYVNGSRSVIVDSEDAAEEIISSIRDKYVDPEKADKYDKVYYGQSIKISRIDTTLGKLMSKNNAVKILDKGENRVRYTVKLGDTVSSITENFEMTETLFYELNPELNRGENTLEEGSKVNVVYKTPKITVITERTVTYDKKIKYKTKKVKTDSLYKGETKVKTKGEYGKKEVTAVVTRENGKEIKRDVVKEQTVKKSVTKVVLVGTKKRPSTVGTGNLINPCPAGYQSSGFGYRWGRLHRGVDLACAAGNNIYAADGGTVVTAGFNYSYGYYVKINHQNGMVTTYAHCSRLLVSAGTKVHKGQTIALVGNTGNSTGAHCHFEVEVNGSLQNPRNYF